MPQSFIINYIHIVFSTKNQAPVIIPLYEDDLGAYISKICKVLGSPALEVASSTDHVHIICELSAKVALDTLVEKIKAHTAKWMKAKSEDLYQFEWQVGYSAFSVSPALLQSTVDYLKTEDERHVNVGFKEELLSTLDHYGIIYDQNHIWE